jgi:ribonuclease P protein component
MRETFHKSERLCSKTLIGKLFDDGHSLQVFPFKLRWIFVPAESEASVQVMFSVPKSGFRKAHDRNLVRRRIREAYRKNKSIFYPAIEKSDRRIALSISYYAKEILSYPEITGKIILILQRLNVELEKSSG